MKKLLIFLLILNSTVAYAQERIFGQDMLALQQSNFKEELSLPYNIASSALGTLDYSFGTEIAPVRNLLASNKFSSLRVHLINTPCIANSNCGSYEIGYGYSLASFEKAVLKKNRKILDFLTNRSKLYCALQKDFPSVKLLISPVLEHRLSIGAFRIAADAVLKGCPDVQLVNNPVTGKGERYKRAWIEAHATSVPADIYSWDGLDATDSDVQAWMKQTTKAKIAFWWARAYNCRAGGGAFVDPRKRTTCPTAQYFELMNHLQDDRGKAPKPTFRAVFKPFSSSNIFKPCSENYEGSSDPRGLLPVAIMPGGGGMMNIVGMRGIRVGQMKFFGAYQGNLNRYYSGTASKLSGYEFEKEATKTNGSPFTWACQSRVCYGPIIGGRRNGLMR